MKEPIKTFYDDESFYPIIAQTVLDYFRAPPEQLSIKNKIPPVIPRVRELIIFILRDHCSLNYREISPYCGLSAFKNIEKRYNEAKKARFKTKEPGFLENYFNICKLLDAKWIEHRQSQSSWKNKSVK